MSGQVAQRFSQLCTPWRHEARNLLLYARLADESPRNLASPYRRPDVRGPTLQVLDAAMGRTAAMREKGHVGEVRGTRLQWDAPKCSAHVRFPEMWECRPVGRAFQSRGFYEQINGVMAHFFSAPSAAVES